MGYKLRILYVVITSIYNFNIVIGLMGEHCGLDF